MKGYGGMKHGGAKAPSASSIKGGGGGKQTRAGKGTIKTPFSRAILKNVGRGR